MPLDPSISLQGKPVQIDTPDMAKTFLTLGQLKYLGAEAARTQAQTQAAQEEAARAQQLFDETGAGRRRLSSLGTVPVGGTAPSPATGGPPFDEATLAALPQGGSTPAPTAAQAGTAPAARHRLINDPDVQAQLYQIAPHVADDLIKAGLSTHASTLESQQKLMENLARPLAIVRDEASYQGWRTMASTVLPPDKLTLFPPTYPGPDGIAKLQQQAQALDTQFKQAIDQSTLAIAQQTEKRLGRKVIVLPGIEQSVLVREFPDDPAGPGTPGPAGTGPGGPSTPGTAPAGIGTPVPGTEKPLSGEEAKAKANSDLAAASNARIEQFEATLAGGDPHDPYKNPPLLSRVSPSLYEETAAHGGAKLGTAAGGVGGALVGGLVGGKIGGPIGVGTGVTSGGAAGAYVGNKAGEGLEMLGNATLSKARQQYNNEQLNFIAAYRGEETSRITRDVFDTERERFFPKYGDSAEEVQRKRQVREEALSAMATRTNRRQGTVPIGQKQATPAAQPPSSPKVFTMEQAWATSRAYGRPVEDVVREAKQQGWTLK